MKLKPFAHWYWHREDDDQTPWWVRRFVRRANLALMIALTPSVVIILVRYFA